MEQMSEENQLIDDDVLSDSSDRSLRSEKEGVFDNPASDEAENSPREPSPELFANTRPSTVDIDTDNVQRSDSGRKHELFANMRPSTAETDTENMPRSDSSRKRELFSRTRPRDVVEPEESDEKGMESGLAVGSSSGTMEEPHEPTELERAIDDLVTRYIPPPVELRSQIADLVEKRRLEALMEGDYDTAEQQDKIATLLQTVLQSEQQKQGEDRAIDQLFQRWQTLQYNQKQITDKWDTKINAFLEEVGQQEEDLQDKQDQEIEEFIARWKDPVFLRPFGKPSPKLLQLREQERAMGLSRMYAQAKEMKAYADKLQREETQAAQARINSQMSLERSKLAAKHDKELQTLKTYKERMLKQMENDKARELRPIKTALAQIKSKKHSPSKLPTLPSGRETSLSTMSQREADTQRAQTKYSQFRAEKKTTLLDIVPVDDAVLQQMRRPGRATRPKTGLTARRQPEIQKTTARKTPSVTRQKRRITNL